MKKTFILSFIFIQLLNFAITLYTYPQDNIKYFKINSTTPDSIAHEFLQELNKYLREFNIKIVYKSTSPKNLSEILRALENDEIQIFIGLAKTDERIKKLKFTNYPLWSVTTSFLTNSENMVYDFDNKKIGIIKSSKSADIAKSYFKNSKFIEFSDISNAINKLLAKKIDFVAYNSFILGYYQSLYPQKLKVVNLKMEKYRQYIAFSKNVDDKIIEIFDNVIKKLYQSEFFLRIFNEYNGIFPGNIVELSSIEWPPYEYIENNKWKGIDYEILKLALEELGFKLIAYKYPWNRCLELIKSRISDAIITLIITNERQKYMYFTKVPISYGIDVYLYLKNNTNKNIAGYIKGYAYPEEFFKSSFKKLPVDSDERGILLLANKRIDLFITNFHVGLFYANKYNLDVSYSNPIKYQKYYAGFSKTYFGKFLSEKVSEKLIEFRQNGMYEKIYKKYNLSFEGDIYEEESN